MIPLEDNVGDIIGKAQRGLRISDTELAEKARVSSQKIRALREGSEFDELALLRICAHRKQRRGAFREECKYECRRLSA